MTTADQTPRPLPTWAAGLLLAAVAIVLVLALSRADPSGAVFFVAYAGIGAYLVIRRPTNSVGWLLMLTGVGLAVGSVRWRGPVESLVSGVLDPSQTFEAWSNGTGWTLAFLGVFGISLVFPGGALPGAGRSRWLARLGLIVMSVLVALIAFGPLLSVTIAATNTSATIRNPLFILPEADFWALVPDPSTLYATMFLIFISGIVALVLRYRRAVGLERLQYRWLVAAIALVAIASAIWAITTQAMQLDVPVGDVLTLLTYPLVPIAIAVAVLRYRLYDIDRIISRTIAYAVVSVILVGVFGLGIVLLSTALASFAAGQTLAVAGSTLIAYAVAQPVLRWVRRAVDRRFDRARYDHERTVAAFTTRLRHEIDVDAVTADLGDDDAIRRGSDVGLALVAPGPQRPMTPSGDHPVDAVVVGAGPNGLAAAITIARAGRSVRVYEASGTAGGGTRTSELTLPGFRHDVCSTVMSLTELSPFFATIDLSTRGVELVHPDAPVAHPLDGGRAAVLERSVAATAAGLGQVDGRAWRRLFGPLVRDAARVGAEILGPVPHVPRHPLALARFGLPALRSTTGLARSRFHDEPARALFAGIGAHAMLRLDRPLSASFGLALTTFAHASGWPVVRGGANAVADALVAELEAAGGEVVTGRRVGSLADLPRSRAVLFDVTPRQLVAIAGDHLPAGTRRGAQRFRYGPGVFKVDWALDGPVPWAAPGARRAATIHLGGTLDEIAASEADVAAGRHPDRPYVLLVQYLPWDPTRAPDGKATAWAYCHVPAGSTVDMTARIEAQVERFAPGFRDRILARATLGPAQMEAYDENYVGGDINGGLQDIRQLIFRPWPSVDPYRVGEGLYLCSSSTPPGGGVHGMSGYNAARSALRHELR